MRCRGTTILSSKTSARLSKGSLLIEGRRPVTVLHRLLDLVDHFHQRLLPFYDSLRQDRVYLTCWLIGSYIVIHVAFNMVTRRAPICSAGPGCQFPSLGVLLLGVVILLVGTLKRLTDL